MHSQVLLYYPHCTAAEAAARLAVCLEVILFLLIFIDLV